MYVLCAVNSSMRRRKSTDPARAGASLLVVLPNWSHLPNSRRTSNTSYAGIKCAYFAFRDCRMSTGIDVQPAELFMAQTGKNGSGKRRLAQKRLASKRPSSGPSRLRNRCQMRPLEARKFHRPMESSLHWRKSRTKEGPAFHQQSTSQQSQINPDPRISSLFMNMQMSMTGPRSPISRELGQAMLLSPAVPREHRRWPVIAVIPTRA